ncbi:MAG: WbqC family protein [Ekhidna sp.]|nr:WbqC family protein [Ekhidna sp.]
MSPLLIEPHYLGSIEYFVLLSHFDEICFEIHESFPKQTYRNRAYFLTSNKVQSLVVPAKYSNGSRTLEVEIDHSQRWVKDHWGAFYSAYGKAPFFEYFEAEFRSVWDTKWESLVELNVTFIKLCFKILQWQKKITLSEEYRHEVNPEYRNLIVPKKSFEGRDLYTPAPYNQLFGGTFVPNLSIVDLLMNEGPNATQLIKLSSLS